MEVAKPVVIDKYEFEYREMPKLKALFAVSSPSSFPQREKINYFPIQNPFTSKKLFIEPLIQKAKLVALDKHEFENRNLKQH